jgi:HTH-type transcriptional regulator / antitoxin HipB
MKKKVNKNLTSFADHLNQQYGKKGTVKRDVYEQDFEAFKLGVLIQEGLGGHLNLSVTY